MEDCQLFGFLMRAAAPPSFAAVYINAFAAAYRNLVAQIAFCPCSLGGILSCGVAVNNVGKKRSANILALMRQHALLRSIGSCRRRGKLW
jgi:hypothetical protein